METNALRFDGKVVLVTGAGNGKFISTKHNLESRSRSRSNYAQHLFIEQNYFIYQLDLDL